MQEPRIVILLYLDKGEPPIVCSSVEEARFLADVWRASHGDLEALKRLREQTGESESANGPA